MSLWFPLQIRAPLEAATTAVLAPTGGRAPKARGAAIIRDVYPLLGPRQRLNLQLGGVLCAVGDGLLDMGRQGPM